MGPKLTPHPPSPDLLERLTPEQREVLAASQQRASQFHQVEISKGLGPERAERADKTD